MYTSLSLRGPPFRLRCTTQHVLLLHNTSSRGPQVMDVCVHADAGTSHTHTHPVSATKRPHVSRGIRFHSSALSAADPAHHMPLCVSARECPPPDTRSLSLSLAPISKLRMRFRLARPHSVSHARDSCTHGGGPGTHLHGCAGPRSILALAPARRISLRDRHLPVRSYLPSFEWLHSRRRGGPWPLRGAQDRGDARYPPGH